MKKINKIEFKINIKKNKFDIDMKHDFSPIKVLMVGNKVMAEYAMLMMQDENTDIFDQDIVSMTKRLEELGDIKLTIEEYESNTFNFSKQIIHEVKYEKGYSIKDVFAIISVAMTYMKDTLVTAYGMDNKVYEMDEKEAVDMLTEFEKNMETYKKISDMYGMAGYVYKNFEDSMENLVSNMAYLSEICGEMANSFMDGGQDIFSEELFEDGEGSSESAEADICRLNAQDSYNRIMGMVRAAADLHHAHAHAHGHSCGCGHDHEEHGHDCGCGHDHEGHGHDCGCGHDHKEHGHDCGCGHNH